MEKIVKGVYRHGEIILLDDVEPRVGDKLVIKIAGREELIKNSLGD